MTPPVSDAREDPTDRIEQHQYPSGALELRSGNEGEWIISRTPEDNER